MLRAEGEHLPRQERHRTDHAGHRVPASLPAGKCNLLEPWGRQTDGAPTVALHGRLTGFELGKREI
jgi:hypothetical protein